MALWPVFRRKWHLLEGVAWAQHGLSPPCLGPIFGHLRLRNYKRDFCKKKTMPCPGLVGAAISTPAHHAKRPVLRCSWYLLEGVTSRGPTLVIPRALQAYFGPPLIHIYKRDFREKKPYGLTRILRGRYFDPHSSHAEADSGVRLAPFGRGSHFGAQHGLFLRCFQAYFGPPTTS